MLAGEDDEELLDLEPGEAAEELLARMLDASRYRAAAATSRSCLAREHGVRFRRAAAAARAAAAQPAPSAGAAPRPAVLGAAIGGLLRIRRRSTSATSRSPRQPSAERLAHLRTLLRRGASTSTRPSPAPTA